MNRIEILSAAGLVACSLSAMPALANGGGDVPGQGDSHGKYNHIIGDKLNWVLDGLQSNGYRVTSIRSGTMGRVRILAENDEHRREIVCDKSTGAIRRDRIVALLAVSVDGDIGVGGRPHNGGGHHGGGSHGGDGSGQGSLVDLDLDLGAGVGVRVGNLSILGRDDDGDDCGCGGSDSGGHGDQHGGGSAHEGGGLGDVVDGVTDTLGL